MKHLVLVFLLVLFSGFNTFGQQSRAREIVKLALKKHTSGKVLKQFEFVMTYEKPGKTNSGILRQDRFLDFMDSLTLTMPDSMKKEMGIQKLEMEKRLSQEIYSLYAGQERRYYVDLPSQTIAQIGISPNPRKGRPDSTRTVYNFKKESLLNEALISNPLALLQFIDNDTTELNYTGIINIENVDYHVIQAKLGRKWVDVYFDQKSNVLSRLTVNGVDEHPFLEKGPVNFKEITSYTNYKKKREFLIPEMIDEIDTRNEFTLRKQLNWVNLNDLFAASTFNPEPVFEDRTKFIISEMGNGLYVLERSGGFVNERFLIRLDSSGMVEIFSALIINDGLNKAELDAVKSKFLGYNIENVFNIGKIWSIESLSGFYSNKTMIYAPKEVGMFAEEKLPADSEEVLKRNEVRKLGLLMTFDKEFQTESVETLILNPVRNDDFESIYVDYYLPKERTIFLYGNPYSADSSTKSATPREKILYDLIKKRSLKVDQLVYSGAYLNNAPLFMTFQEFETRIKNTDFSIYDRDKR